MPRLAPMLVLLCVGCYARHASPREDASLDAAAERRDAPETPDAGLDDAGLGGAGMHDAGLGDAGLGPCVDRPWQVELVDGDTSRYGDLDVAVADDGSVHVAYTRSPDAGGLWYARRDRSGWTRALVQDRVATDRRGRTVWIGAHPGVRALVFGAAPDSAASAVWWLGLDPPEVTREVLMPRGTWFNLLPAPYVRASPAGGRDVVAYRARVDGLAWATFDGAWSNEFDPWFASTAEFEAVVAPDGERVVAHRSTEILHGPDGRPVEFVDQLTVRRGADARTYPLERRPPGPVPDQCGREGLGLAARAGGVDLVFAYPETDFAGAVRCVLWHFALDAGEVWSAWPIAPRGSHGLELERDERGVLHVALLDSEVIYLRGGRGAWTSEAVPFEEPEQVRAVRVGSRGATTAVAVALESDDAQSIWVAHRRCE